MKEKINKRYDQLSELENFKQLSEDLETGKKFIRDYKDISIENNSFGMPSIKYNKNITGQQSYDSRLNKGYIKELKYGPLQYLPNTSHFIGSSMYPRPISIPFTNQMKKSTNLINLINKKKIFQLFKNQKIFDLERQNKNIKSLPKYFCVKLGANSPKTRNHLIKLFEENIENKKEEYNNDPQCYLKDSKIKGLIKYKKYLQINLTKNLYNGNKIPYTKQKDINTKFKIINNLVKKEGFNKMHLGNDNNYIIDSYKKLYKIKRVGNKNNIFKKNYSLINSFEINKKLEKKNLLKKDKNINNNNYTPKNDNIKKRKSLNALISPRNRNIHNHVYFSIDKSRQRNIYNLEKEKRWSSFHITNKSNIKKLNYNLNSELSNINSNKRNIYSPRIFHNFNINLLNFDSDNKSGKNINGENIKNFNLNRSQEIKNKKIKNLDEIIENCEHENRLIKGYQSEPETEEEYEDEGFKKRPPKYVSPIMIYKKEIETFKKVNPIEYNRQLNKKLYEDQLLLIKLTNRRNFQKNINKFKNSKS